MRYKIVEEHDNRVRVRVEYVVLGGPESYHNYPMLWSDREQGFFVFPGAPSWGRLAMDVYVCWEYRYGREVESMICIVEEHFNVPIFNVYHPQEGFSGRRGGDVANQYSTEVEEYKRTDTATFDCLYHQGIALLVIGQPKPTTLR